MAVSAESATLVRIGCRVAAAQHLQEEPEFQRGVALRLPLRSRSKNILGFLVLAALDERAGMQGDERRIELVLLGERHNLVVPPLVEGTRGELRRRLRGGSRRRQGSTHLRDRDSEGNAEHERGGQTERLARHPHII